MGGLFGAALRRDCVIDVYFGVDYHSHLGTRCGGMAFYDKKTGFSREIHMIENTPFRTAFENDLHELHGNLGIGCISDSDPQPLLVRSHHGVYAICTVGVVNNAEELIEKYMSTNGCHLMAMDTGKENSVELVAALIDRKDTIVEGIKFAQEVIEGTMAILIMKEDCLIAARDKVGRLPILIGKSSDGMCVSFESFAYQKLGFSDVRNLGPGQIVRITPDGYETLSEHTGGMKICAFLWSYYGYPNSNYEGVNVEQMRNRNGRIIARNDIENGCLPNVDCIAGVPDSGIPHAIGYANECGIPFSRPLVKYTPTWPRSFMPSDQSVRNRIAKMKQIPVPELIKNKKLLFVDDSIVRGTQMHETVDFLYENGASEVHVRSACPPIMYSCKYLNFSRGNSDMELIARRGVQQLEGNVGQQHLEEYADPKTERGCALRKCIASELKLTSLEYQTIDGLLEAIGIPEKYICTYCWTGKE